jgi:hypothetical protein
MFKIRLIKGRSYNGVVTATNKNPIIEVADEAKAKKALASGYFELIEQPAPQTPPKTSGEQGGEADEAALGKMTEKELDAYAKANGISLSGINKKADKLAKILEAVAQADGAEGGSEPDFRE